MTVAGACVPWGSETAGVERGESRDDHAALRRDDLLEQQRGHPAPIRADEIGIVDQVERGDEMLSR